MSAQKQIRTTVSLPEKSLSAAKRIAKSRHVNLSTVIAEALDGALDQEQKRRAARERAEAIMDRYQKAFGGFSEEELMVLDGVVLTKKR